MNQTVIAALLDDKTLARTPFMDLLKNQVDAQRKHEDLLAKHPEVGKTDSIQMFFEILGDLMAEMKYNELNLARLEILKLNFIVQTQLRSQALIEAHNWKTIFDKTKEGKNRKELSNKELTELSRRFLLESGLAEVTQ